MSRLQHRTVIRREHPVLTPLRRGVFVLCFAGLLIATFYAGWYMHARQPSPLQTDSDLLRGELVALQTRGKVDAQAIDELRTQLAASRGSVEELEQELAFYREVLAPEKRKSGVLIRDPVLTETADDSEFLYQLVVQRGGQVSGADTALLRGKIEVVIVGEERGLPREYRLPELHPSPETEGLKLAFRYFQRLSGRLRLPPGFVPGRVTVTVTITKPKNTVEEKSYAWQALMPDPDGLSAAAGNQPAINNRGFQHARTQG